jgi:DNA-binding NarL/FixJ family response regulator
VKPIIPFTPVEQRIFALYLEGKSVKQICALSHVSVGSIGFLRKRMLQKLGKESIAQAIREHWTTETAQRCYQAALDNFAPETAEAIKEEFGLQS